MDIGASLVVKTVDALADGNYTPIPQTELISDSIKHAPKIFKENCRVEWQNDVEKTRNLIRGLSPYPTAWSLLVNSENGEEIQTKIYFAEKAGNGENTGCGTIETDGTKNLLVACGNGWLNITDIQLAGKKRMKTDEFLRGFQQIGKYKFV
jgi:methionyl-tRNA formyltransferase